MKGVQVSIVICMGVSGVGKSTIGRALATRMGGVFLDADDFHPAANKWKMEQGIPLQDADRWGWLDALNQALVRRAQEGAAVILACSALKKSYRERLVAGLPKVSFVFLKAPPDVVRERLAGRAGHFMPASLLDSQFAALEEPGPGSALVVDARAPVGEIVDQITTALFPPGRA